MEHHASLCLRGLGLVCVFELHWIADLSNPGITRAPRVLAMFVLVFKRFAGGVMPAPPISNLRGVGAAPAAGVGTRVAMAVPGALCHAVGGADAGPAAPGIGVFMPEAIATGTPGGDTQSR